MSIGNEITENDWFIPPIKYEYLDHTADVQIHAWGDTLQESFEQCANGMYGYVTDIDYVEMNITLDIEAEGHDLESLLYNYLDELLYNFCADPYFIARKVQILEFDREAFKIKARAFGEEFKIGKHPQGADIKAITYASMQIIEADDKCEVYAIVDI